MAPNGEEAAPDVSVIVPFHNSGEYIERCVNGLLEQTYPLTGYEIILIDNNSTDNSVAIVEKYPRIQLLHEAKQGAYAARNRGINASRGRFLAFTDADCIPATNWLSELMVPFVEQGVGLVQGRRLFGSDALTLSMLAAYEAETHAYIFSGSVQGAVFGYTNNMAVRRDIFDQCGPFLETARGADSIFVDKVVRAFSHRVLRYAREACIQHLEITSVRQWLQKKVLYGRSFQRHRSQRPSHRAPTPAELSTIFRNTIQKERYSVAKAGLLFAVIWVGSLSFRYGRLTGREQRHS